MWSKKKRVRKSLVSTTWRTLCPDIWQTQLFRGLECLQDPPNLRCGLYFERPLSCLIGSTQKRQTLFSQLRRCCRRGRTVVLALNVARSYVQLLSSSRIVASKTKVLKRDVSLILISVKRTQIVLVCDQLRAKALEDSFETHQHLTSTLKETKYQSMYLRNPALLTLLECNMRMLIFVYLRA